MLDGDINRYLSVGISAIKSINSVVEKTEFESILDIPCGHGRVTRHFNSIAPNASVFVADLDEYGVDFCVKTFGATKLQSNIDFDKLDFKRKFDLIWVGSLITHLPQENTKSFLNFVSRHLSKRGFGVITSHGAFVAGRCFESTTDIYGLKLEKVRMLYDQYLICGYGFQPYEHNESYGISVISRAWIENAVANAGMAVIKYDDHSWDNHQDTFSVRNL